MLTQEAIFIATIKGTSLKSKLDHSPRNCVWCQMNGRVHPAQQFLNSYPDFCPTRYLLSAPNGQARPTAGRLRQEGRVQAAAVRRRGPAQVERLLPVLGHRQKRLGLHLQSESCLTPPAHRPSPPWGQPHPLRSPPPRAEVSLVSGRLALPGLLGAWSCLSLTALSRRPAKAWRARHRSATRTATVSPTASGT